MSPLDVRALTRAHKMIGVDSNVLIHLLEGGPPQADVAGALLDAVARGESTAVISTLAIAEVAAGPARVGELALVGRYAEELSSLENMRVVSVDREVAVEAAILRGTASVTTADAIHLATARGAGATVFVTNDRRIPPIARMEILLLDDLVA
jgi:predicted nucleic acid-binding protein